MTVEYTTEIGEQIISHLDGWVIETAEEEEEIINVKSAGNEIVENNTDNQESGEVQPFITDITTYADNPNKKISSEEVQTFYEQALSKSYIYCNRLNVEDLTLTERDLFIKGVCLLAASDLWNKFNIRVNNEDMEDTYVQSYGGLLYKQSINILNSFINQRITTLTSLKNKNNCNNTWIL